SWLHAEERPVHLSADGRPVPTGAGVRPGFGRRQVPRQLQLLRRARLLGRPAPQLPSLRPEPQVCEGVAQRDGRQVRQRRPVRLAQEHPIPAGLIQLRFHIARPGGAPCPWPRRLAQEAYGSQAEPSRGSTGETPTVEGGSSEGTERPAAGPTVCEEAYVKRLRDGAASYRTKLRETE